MKKLFVIPAIVFALVSCGGNSEPKSVTDELNESWSEMTDKDQATFCLGYIVVSEEEFREGASERFGEEDADEAVSWAESMCD